MFGSYGNAVGPTSLAFVSQASRERVGEYGLAKEVVPVEHCRDIGKADMRLNDVVPNIEVDPETYKVNVDGEEITCDTTLTGGKTAVGATVSLVLDGS